jgi:DNA-binding CsgD family transcriptional regulator
VDYLSKSLPRDFFDLYDISVFSRAPRPGDAQDLEGAAMQIASATPEFRDRFLALAGDDPDASVDLVPRPFADYRRSFVLLDRAFRVTYVSPGSQALLGQAAVNLRGQPVSAFVDGVDLVTLKHECQKLGPGLPAQTPFVLSVRMAPGAYEPREATVDAVTSGHQVVAYLVSLSRVEPVRGPRAVYRQLKEEKAHPDRGAAAPDESVTQDEEVSGDLHGTLITRREHEIILLVLRGMTNNEISSRLHIAEVTVKKHLTSIYRKLRIGNRAELRASFSRPGGEE